jgi:transcriptional regulator with XRE-family HTH domain
MAPIADLGSFLRTRRAALTPAAAGLPGTERRRVPGLRREELAQLAGVSVDYYIRLEQGRGSHPSAGVLDALARALGLDETETAYMHTLAATPAVRRRARPERVRPELQRILDALMPTPAYVLGRRMDVLAWNDMAARLVGDFAAMPPEARNRVRHVVLDPAARALYVEWERVAQESVAHLRLVAAHHPDDPALAALVGELSVRSEHFRRWWADHHVREKSHGCKLLAHPIVGRLELTWEALAVGDNPDLRLVVYTAEPGSPSATALELLAHA